MGSEGLRIIENISSTSYGNDCLIHKTALIGYLPVKDKYIVIQIQCYSGSWTSDEIYTETIECNTLDEATSKSNEFLE